MNNLLVVLFFLYILNHVPVSEICVFLSCAGCYSTGATSGQYQLIEEDINSSTRLSSSRDSCRRRRATPGWTVLPTTETPTRGGRGGVRRWSRCWGCDKWIVLSDSVAVHYNENPVPVLGDTGGTTCINVSWIVLSEWVWPDTTTRTDEKYCRSSDVPWYYSRQ